MDFRIADTVTNSLARLAGDEQKAAKTRKAQLRALSRATKKIMEA